MVLIKTESTFTGKRPCFMKNIEEKRKHFEIFMSQKGMMQVEETQPSTEEVTVVYSKKEEAELERMFASIK
jgi:hypothetical protein